MKRENFMNKEKKRQFVIIISMFAFLLLGCEKNAESVLQDNIPKQEEPKNNETEDKDDNTQVAILDTDNDGLTDTEELVLGTDINKADTDSDSYSDADEVHFGSNPLDTSSVIYKGYWPYNRFKEGLNISQTIEAPYDGKKTPNIIFVDKNEDEISIYDFINPTRPIVIMMCSMWCPVCQRYSGWLASGSTPIERKNSL